MTERSTQHGTFTIERTLPFPPARVFAAFADPEAKGRWFGPPPDVAKVVITEQGVFLDGRWNNEQREQGTRYLMDCVERSLGGAAAGYVAKA